MPSRSKVGAELYHLERPSQNSAENIAVGQALAGVGQLDKVDEGVVVHQKAALLSIWTPIGHCWGDAKKHLEANLQEAKGQSAPKKPEENVPHLDCTLGC
jgi:hypothetical protein